MGLLDNIAGQVGGMAGNNQGGNSGLIASAMKMLSNYPGGITGLISSFNSKGLGDVISSWIETGSNKTISQDQLENALGREHIDQVAKDSGQSYESTKSGLASLLPSIIDKLTPGGSVSNGNILQKGMGMLGKNFGL